MNDAVDAYGKIRLALEGHESRRVPDSRRKIEAAVAVVVREGDQGFEVLLIHRAESASDPWSGQMALPGGRVEPTDENSLQAAIRETREEVALDLEGDATFLGRLSETSPRGHGRRLGLVIMPFLFGLIAEPSLALNDEVQGALWVPLSFLGDRSNRSWMWRWRSILPIRLPCYRYNGYLLWGLTLRILDELMEFVE